MKEKQMEWHTSNAAPQVDAFVALDALVGDLASIINAEG